MKKENEPHIVPSQNEGKEIIIKESTSFPTEKEAKEFFNTAKDRLRNVNQWRTLTGDLSAEFQLQDSNGNTVDRYIEKGDLFRIDIPGPGSQAGGGYDWVQIEAIEMHATPSRELFSFRVRPTTNPDKEHSGIAHFYAAVSTSTFTVKRNKNTVGVGIYDRNIKPNIDAESSLDKLRDTVVGVFGMFGFSKIQWTQLANGILSKE